MKRGLLYIVLAVVSLGAGIGAGLLAKSYLEEDPEPVVTRPEVVRAEPVREPVQEQPVEAPADEAVAQETPAQATVAQTAPVEEKAQETAPEQPKTTAPKPIDKLSKKALETAFNSGDGDNVRKYSKKFANYSKCPVYCGGERKTLSQIVSDVSNSYPPVRASVTSIDYDSLGRVKSVRVSLVPAQ